MRLIYLIIIMSILILIIPVERIVAQDENKVESEFEDDGFEFHCTIGAIGILLILLVFGTGFLTSGRFGRIRNTKTLMIHKIGTIVIALFFTVQAVYGFFMLGWFFLPNIHGYLGFSIPIVAWLTVGFSPCIVKKIIKWKNASRIHTVLAIILLLLVIFQVVYANILET
jgi:hypothetical protein